MEWRRLFKFRSGPVRARPPKHRPAAALHIETQYELREPEGEVLTPRGEDAALANVLSMLSINDEAGDPVAVVAATLTSVEANPYLVINSLYGPGLIKPWTKCLGLEPLVMRKPLSWGMVVSHNWGPVPVPLRCGWMPRKGLVEIDLMPEVGAEYGSPGPWIGVRMMDVDGRTFFEYYGEGIAWGGAHRIEDCRWRLTQALWAAHPERITCQL